MLCKTIILSSSQNLNNNPKGILTLSNEDNYIKGKIRLYNINTLPPGTKIGLYIDKEVYISTITKRPNHYEFVLEQNIDITKSVYCALIDTGNNKQVILEGGSFNGFYFTDSPFDAILEAKDPELEEQISKALNNQSDCNNCNCENCEYKQYFYNNHLSDVSNNNIPHLNKNIVPSQNEASLNQDVFINQASSLNENDINNEVVANENATCFDTQQESIEPNLCNTELRDNKTIFQESVVPELEKELMEELKARNPSITSNDEYQTTNNNIDNVKSVKNVPNDLDLSQNEKLEFLNDIIYQLDELFFNYPEDNNLTRIIPNSKFVLVDGENPYVLGAIYEDNIMKYIAYGVPAHYNSLPPNDLGKHYQWLPLNPRDVMSDGYFMIYQNALTGSIVEIDFE